MCLFVSACVRVHRGIQCNDHAVCVCVCACVSSGLKEAVVLYVFLLIALLAFVVKA